MDSAAPPKPPEHSPDDVLLVGRIGAAHGIRGWVHLTSFTDPPENLAELGPLLMRPAGPGAAAAGWQPAGKIKIKRTGSSAKPRLLALVAGVDTRSGAEGLRGLELGLQAQNLPAPDPDSFYWRDLVGLAAIDPLGQRLGQVAEVLETPAHDVLIIAIEPALAAQLALEAPEVLVPFVSEFTQTIDLKAQTIIINWPEVFVPAKAADSESS